MNFKAIMTSSKKRPDTQKGFTLVELLVVMAIMSLMLFFSFPIWKPLVIKTKVSAAASEMQRAIATISANHATHHTDKPYENASTKELAGVLTGSSIFRVGDVKNKVTDDQGVEREVDEKVITHELGATGAAVTYAPTGDNTGATITLAQVNAGACPGFVAALQNSVEEITINGQVVKAAAADGQRTYNASAAAGACTAFDTNTFAITFR